MRRSVIQVVPDGVDEDAYGLGQYARAQLRALQRLGLKVSAVTGRGTSDGRPRQLRCEDWLASILHLNWELSLMVADAVGAERRNGTDPVVCVHGDVLGWVAICAARQIGVPSLLTLHTAEEKRSSPHGRYWRYLVRLRGLALDASGAAIVPSQSLRSDIAASCPSADSKTFVVYPSVRDFASADGLSRRDWGEHPRLIFVGRLDGDKRPLHALEVFERVLEQWHTGTMHFIGAGPHRTEIESESSARGYRERVVVHGYMRGGDLEAAYNEADLVVIASQYESLSLVALEAASRGCPIVAYDVGGIGEVLGGYQLGRLVPSGSREALGSAALEVLEEVSGLGRKESVDGRFAEERMAQETLRALNHACGRHSRVCCDV